MADILGPSGQPLPPSNPFAAQQSSGISGNLSINTSSAQKAMEDFQNSLDRMMKGFGGSWDKVTKDSMAAQERFYRYIGDKDNERRTALKRYTNDAKTAIDEELKAKLTAFDQEAQAGKRTQDEIRKDKARATLEAHAQAENISRESAKKMARENGIGGAIRGVTSFVGGQIGGPIGGLVSGVGNVLTNPAEIIPAAIIGSLIEILNKRAAFAKTGAQLAGAGFNIGGGQTAGSNFDLGLFKGLNGALSADEQRNIIGGMTGSRTLIGQARTNAGMEGIRGNLGLFANILPDASKEMEIFTDGAKSLGMSTKDMSNTFMSTRVNADRLKITQLDAIQTQMDMQKALRNITNDGLVAANVLNNVGGFFHDIGKSEGEVTRMTMGVAQAGANLPLEKILGMSAFVNGGKMPSMEALFGTPAVGIGPSNQGLVNNPFALMGQFLTKVGGQGKNPLQKILMANQLNKDMGLGIQTQDLPQFFKLASTLGQPGGLNTEDFAKKAQALAGKSTTEMMNEGMKTLKDIVSPLEALEKFFSNFWTKFDHHLTTDIKEFMSPKDFLHDKPRHNTTNKVTAGKDFYLTGGH